MDAFNKLDSEKQMQIINAAMKEFAEKGFDQASTNSIVKEASIGKGMLFYYFKSKQDLYHYLIGYSLDFLKNEYLNKVNIRETDFMERVKQATTIKMKSYKNHPDLFHFLGNIFMNDEKLPNNLQQKYEELHKLSYSLLYDNINTALFRTDIDVKKAFRLIQWSIDGYENDLIGRLKGKNLATLDFDPLWDEFFEYLEVLKKAFYEK